ncbi:MAG: BolA/IbaG family iron-sulfur metabolism protein [Alphaproteobacteria bacterium]
MMTNMEHVTQLLKEAFPEGFVQLEDLVGDDNHLKVSVISPAFADKTKVQQHQMVYLALRGKMDQELHALSIETRAP